MDEIVERSRQEAENRIEQQLEARRSEARQIRNRLDGLLDGTDTGILCFLYEKGQAGSTRLGSCDYKKIADLYGEDIADGFKSGLRRFWRQASVEDTLKGAPGRISSTRYLALAGLATEFAVTGDLNHLSQDERARVAKIGLFELNGCPEWYEHLAELAPDAVEAALRELAHHPSFDSILSATARTGPCTSKIASQVALDVLSSANDLSQPYLKAAAELLLMRDDRGTGNTKLHQMVDALMPRLDGMESDEKAFWCAFSFVASPLQAFQDMERILSISTGESKDSDSEIPPLVKVLSTLYRWRDHLHIAVTPLKSASYEDVGPSARVQCSLLKAAYEFLPPSSDVLSEHAKVYDDYDYARHMRDSLLSELLAHPRREVRSALLAMIRHPIFAEYKDWIASEIDRMQRQDVLAAPLSIDDAYTWVSGQGSPHTVSGLFRLVQEIIDDIVDHAENDDFSLKEILRIPSLVKEHELQLWLASEIERRGRGAFAVSRETVIPDLDRRDILIEQPDINAKVVVEVKVAEHWTGPVLQARLQDQLVDQYMRPRNCKFGIYLLFRQGPEAGKQTWEINGVNCNFAEVVERLKAEARVIVDRPLSAGVQELDVVGIDLRRVHEGRRGALRPR